MSRKIKRVSILAVIAYVMINSFVWGLMKAYVNSYNAVNHEQLAMVSISDKPAGKEINVMGIKINAPQQNMRDEKISCALKTLVPLKIRAAAIIFMQTGQEIVQEALK